MSTYLLILSCHDMDDFLSMKEGLKGKVIVCTGGTGFIGKHLLASLANSGARVVSLSRRSVKTNLPIEELVADFSTLSQNFWIDNNIQEIDALIHLAGFTPKDITEGYDIEKIYLGNIVALHTLLENIPTVDRIVFSSTLDVYGGFPDGIKINEETPVSPQNMYAVSKLYGERLVSTWAKEKGASYALLRYGHIYGPGESAYRKFIPLAISNALNDKPITVYGSGKAKRDFLYVKDAVEATLRALISDKDIDKVNVVSGISVTISEVAEMITNISQNGNSVVYDHDKPDGQSFSFDNRRMHEYLGEWKTVCLEKGLKNEIEYMKGE